MALEMKSALAMVLALLSFVSMTSAIPGTATFYTQYVPSACYGNEDEGTRIAAASDTLWDNGGACGRMYRVMCTRGTGDYGAAQPCKGGSVTVKIVDRCPSTSCHATLDLSQEAFSDIADPVQGKINIDYTQ
ncbi:putative EG45-like domain containing protein 1 [Prosopis cineraria]|uniref:putative EG45-like domain containing protein 1 n=1 Tax=Prosopis cineraria TaxID=364024 RepID=UPI00240F56AB|nr:putative EG45-like domain containing protein 1 [Prosopis cineraria]